MFPLFPVPEPAMWMGLAMSQAYLDTHEEMVRAGMLMIAKLARMNPFLFLPHKEE